MTTTHFLSSPESQCGPTRIVDTEQAGWDELPGMGMKGPTCRFRTVATVVETLLD